MISGILIIDGHQNQNFFQSTLCVLFASCNIDIELKEGRAPARMQWVIEFTPSDGESDAQSLEVIRRLVSGALMDKLDYFEKGAHKKLCSRNARLSIGGKELLFQHPAIVPQAIESLEGIRWEGLIEHLDLLTFSIKLQGSKTPLIFSEKLWPELSKTLGQTRIAVEGILRLTTNRKESLVLNEQESLRMLKVVHGLISEAINLIENEFK